MIRLGLRWAPGRQDGPARTGSWRGGVRRDPGPVRCRAPGVTLPATAPQPSMWLAAVLLGDAEVGTHRS